MDSRSVLLDPVRAIVESIALLVTLILIIEIDFVSISFAKPN